MSEYLRLKEGLEKLSDKLDNEIIYTAWINKIYFQNKSINELLRILDKKKPDFTASVFKKSLVGLELLENKKIEVSKISLKYSAIKFERAETIDTLGKYPLFTYNEKGELIKIQYGKHCSLLNLTIGLLNVIESRMPSILDEKEEKKLVLK